MELSGKLKEVSENMDANGGLTKVFRSSVSLFQHNISISITTVSVSENMDAIGISISISMVFTESFIDYRWSLVILSYVRAMWTWGRGNRNSD